MEDQKFVWYPINRGYECQIGGYRFVILKNKETLRHDGNFHFYTTQIYQEGDLQPMVGKEIIQYLVDAKCWCVDYYNKYIVNVR